MLDAAFIKWALAGAATGALVMAIGGAYALGRHDGAANAAIAAKTALIDQLNERGAIDGTVSKMSAADLCARLGGVWRDDRCE